MDRRLGAIVDDDQFQVCVSLGESRLDPLARCGEPIEDWTNNGDEGVHAGYGSGFGKFFLDIAQHHAEQSFHADKQ